MKGFAIHNAPTNHGGIIPSSQVNISQMGVPFVRAGDGHFCPKCKCWSTVQPSHGHIIFDGKPVAYVGDKLSCGAEILPQQSHVVGDSSSASYRSISQINNAQSTNTEKAQPASSLVDSAGYETFYIEQYKTNVFIQHKAVIPPSEKDSKGVSLLQMLEGAVSYFLNYKVSGNELFVSVSINAYPLSNDATVYPFGDVTILRDEKIYAKVPLKKESGFWATDNNKVPVGSCTISLPSPNLSVVNVEIKLGYTARYNETVGKVSPSPSTKTYKFTITSMARKI